MRARHPRSQDAPFPGRAGGGRAPGRGPTIIVPGPSANEGRAIDLPRGSSMSSAAAAFARELPEASPPPSLAVDLAGLTLASPVVLLSGCVGFGEEYTRVAGFSNRDAGAVCLKGTTLEPRLGNPPHRVYETPCGMLNSIGLQNPGSREVIDRILPGLDFGETRFFANVAGATIGEYEELARRFDDSPVDAIEINISCPNVEEGGLIFGNDPVMSARVVEVCRRATSKPLFTKLSPNQTDVAENARRCIEAGTDGLAVVNTFVGMAIDVETGRPVIGAVRAGLSGPAIKPLALHLVYEAHRVAAPHGVPIIGQGGIASAEDAIEFLLAGASAVGIGTALFYDPLVCRKVNEGLAEWLVRRGVGGVGGVAETARAVRAAAAGGGAG